MENKTANKPSSHKIFFGLPVQWDLKNAWRDVWNPDESRVFPPKRFGVGWGLNFHALLKKAKVIKK